MFTSNTLSDKPLLFLAPMDDITDFAFRSICKGLGADVTISEFVASEALIRNIEKTKRKLIFSPDERPFGIQIFGNIKKAV
jgi:tRNA-dihydrouridine synthase